MIPHIDWTTVKFVIFDVDGTLYNQRKIRLIMAIELLRYAISNFDFGVFSILRSYRRYREQLGDEEVFNFEPILVQKTSEQTGYDESKVISVVHEWIEIRPLKYLKSARYQGVQELFDALKKDGKTIGIFSDYPATKKIDALGLSADLIVCAPDEGIQVLKPHPKGLNVLMRQMGCKPHETVLVGDRYDRDGIAAKRVDVQYLIKTKKALNRDERSFVSFNDSIFSEIIGRNR